MGSVLLVASGASVATRFVDLDTVALLELVRAGDHDAYGELFARYHAFATSIARRLNRRHADDLVAESFRRILTAISHGAGPTQGFGPYLAATIRSAAACLAAPFQEVELDVTTLVEGEPGDVDPRVSTAYLSLPEPWQRALWYGDVEGMSPRHAAPLLGLPTANAFSALRKRARAGLRSAYLTQVVDGACNEDVRRHLELLMAGAVTAEVVDDVVDEHLRECDECAAIAFRVGAVTGSRVGLALAPALLAFHGFAAGSALLPVGLGLTGVVGWVRRLPKHVAAAGSVGVATGLVVASVAVGSTWRGSDADLVPVPSAADAAVALGRPTDGISSAGAGGVGASPESDVATPGRATARTTPMTPMTSSTPTSTAPMASATSTASSTASSTAMSTATPTRIEPATPVGPLATTAPAIITTIAAPSGSATTATPTATATTAAPTTVSPTTVSPTTVITPPATTAPTTAPTTTAPTTTIGVASPGIAQITDDRTIGVGKQVKKRITISVTGLTGAPGRLEIGVPFAVRGATNLSCDGDGCTLGGVVAPAVASVEFETAAVAVVATLRDGAGTMLQTLVSP
jgi:DNA-directed RNA polymerase specialized sigma24 family protein